MNPKPQIQKVVLAYSGGLDTSVIVPWLKENYGCEVVCFCADVGQGDEDLSKLEGKAIASGASQFIVHDMKEEFANDYLFPMLRAGAVYERKYLLGTSVARPLIAKHLVDVAHEVGADAMATTRCASNSPLWRSTPACKSSHPGANGTSVHERMHWSTRPNIMCQ